MTITIGRFGTDPTVRNPSQITRAGDKVQVSGWVQATTKAAMNALIQQLNGLMGPDEPTVPLTYSYDSTWDGYYTVNGVSHDLDPNWERTFKFKYTVDLTRLSSYPVVEMIVYGADRTGNPGITETPWHAVPSTWRGYDYGATTAIATGPRALTASTSMSVYHQASYLSATATAGAAPAEAYTGAATIKAGATLYTVHGRQIENTPSDWELSNGLIRVTASTGAGNHWVYATRNAGGTAWATDFGMTLGLDSGGYTVLPYGVTPRSVTILRNSPEECVIRLAYQPESANSAAVAVDLGLRRGARHCSVTLRTHNDQAWGLGFQTAAAGGYSNVSAFAVSIRETSNNADGNRCFVGITDSSPTRDLTNGTILMSGAGVTMDGFFGCAPAGGSAATPDGANEIEAEYYAAVTEKQRIVPQ